MSYLACLSDPAVSNEHRSLTRLLPCASRCSADTPIKQCPMCGVYIERNQGCAQMLCKNCKHTFCWYCLQNLDVSTGPLFDYNRQSKAAAMI